MFGQKFFREERRRTNKKLKEKIKEVRKKEVQLLFDFMK